MLSQVHSMVSRLLEHQKSSQPAAGQFINKVLEGSSSSTSYLAAHKNADSQISANGNKAGDSGVFSFVGSNPDRQLDWSISGLEAASQNQVHKTLFTFAQ